MCKKHHNVSLVFLFMVNNQQSPDEHSPGSAPNEVAVCGGSSP